MSEEVGMQTEQGIVIETREVDATDTQEHTNKGIGIEPEMLTAGDKLSLAADSGQRKNFVSGAQRDRVPGKGRYVLLSPIAMHRIALRAEQGEVKYGDGRNWEKGMPLSEFLDSALRHIYQYMSGDTSEDHLAAAGWNIQAAMHIEVKMPEMQDIPGRDAQHGGK